MTEQTAQHSSTNISVARQFIKSFFVANKGTWEKKKRRIETYWYWRKWMYMQERCGRRLSELQPSVMMCRLLMPLLTQDVVQQNKFTTPWQLPLKDGCWPANQSVLSSDRGSRSPQFSLRIQVKLWCVHGLPVSELPWLTARSHDHNREQLQPLN